MRVSNSTLRFLLLGLAAFADLNYAPNAYAGPFEDGNAALTKSDYSTAARYFKLAADQGVAVAQYNLGLMYHNGQGVPQDYREAVRYYKLAADQGVARAQYNLGVMYEEGRGVPQDYREAVRYYKLAADQGDAKAQSSLGIMYYEGQGVPQDFILAHMWINLGASSSSGEDAKKALTNRDIVARMMTAAQIESAQNMARACQSSNFKRCGPASGK